MELTYSQLLTVKESLSYAVLFAKTEHETAAFSLLLIDVQDSLIRESLNISNKERHDKMGCPFKYCDSNPKCEGKCRYSHP